tara:strand:- start:347 stop:670 length:324 start_codon:yes stop_codon:yes gene_type:complete
MSNIISIREKLESTLGAVQRRKDARALSDAEANHANRKSKAHLYLAPAWIMSGIVTANGFALKAEEAGLNDFKGLLLAYMASLVAAILIGGASAMLLELASEMEPDQ